MFLFRLPETKHVLTNTFSRTFLAFSVFLPVLCMFSFLCLNIIVLFRFRKPFCDETFLLIEGPRGEVKSAIFNGFGVPAGTQNGPLEHTF